MEGAADSLRGVLRADRKTGEGRWNHHGEGPAEVAVPPGVVTAMGPVVAPAGTVALTWVDESTVKAASVPLNVTPVAPFRFVPVRVTEVPTWPDVGVKLVWVGGGVRVTVQE